MNNVGRQTAALAAGASIAPFNGTPLNVAAFNGFLEASIVGGAGLTYDLIVDGQALAVGVPMQAGAAFGALPDTLEFINEKVWHRANIVLTINNPTAGALNFFAYLRLSDVPRGG